jgi:hypothetical protein
VVCIPAPKVEVALARIVVVAVPLATESMVVEAPAVNCCRADHVLACAVLSEATTAPVVGEMVSEVSELATELTAPEPLPQAVPVEESLPEASAWTQVVPPPKPREETIKSVVEPRAEIVRRDVVALVKDASPAAVSVPFIF